MRTQASRPPGSALAGLWGAQTKQGREKLLADYFRDEAARQLAATGVSGQGEVAEVFQLREIECEAVRKAEAAQDASLQGERLRLENIQLDSMRQVWRLGKNGGGKIVKECTFGGGDLGGFTQSLAQLRIVVSLKSGKQLAADAIAQKLRTEIGGVLAKWLAEGAEKLLDLPAGDGEHGTDETRRWLLFRGEDGFGSGR